MSAPMRAPVQAPEAPEALMECLMGFVRTHALRAAVAIGLPEALGDGVRDLDGIVAATGADPAGVRRLLRCLAEAGAVREVPDGWALSGWGRGLLPGIPGSARDYVSYVVDVVAPAAPHLGDLVGSGIAGAPFTRATDREFFAHLAHDRTAGALFDAAMASTLAGLRHAVATRDWSGVRTVVDVGGGTGSLLAGVLAAQPHLRGVLAEQPHVLAAAGEVVADVRDRLRLVECDFFTAVPAGADAYLMARILHDWDDESALRILATVRAAMPAHARLHLVELVLGGDTGWSMAYDLMMGLLLPGHERTEAEWRTLLARAGLVLERVDPAGWRGSVLTARADPTGP